MSTTDDTQTGTPKLEDQKPNFNLQVDSASLPNFWHSNPKLWFMQAELIMSSANYKADTTKFNHIIKHLNETQCNLVSDIVLNPPTIDKYETLKNVLIQRSEDTEMKKIQSVLQTVEMGNHSPSSFHRQLVRLAGDSRALSAELIKKLWISRLPPTIGAILLGMENSDMSQLYETADRIWGMGNSTTNPFFAVNEIRGNSSKSVTSNSENIDIHELCKSINELKLRFDRFENQRDDHRGRSRNRDRSRSRSNSRSYNKNYKLCWYHYKYGKNARKCDKPDCLLRKDINVSNPEN